MKRSNTRIFIFLIFYLFITNCGFTPIYKIGGNGFDLEKLSVEFTKETSYDTSQIIKKFFGLNDNSDDYVVLVDVSEEFVPVIINTNGTVSKYQINITISFEVIDEKNNLLFKDIAVGLSQFDVQTSEIENEELQKQMLRSATNDAASLMMTKIQSKLSF